MIIFAEILRGVGLSQQEAADWLNVSLDSVKSWGQGRRTPPTGILAELHALAERQDRAAHMGAASWVDAGSPAVIEIGLASDDHEAADLGWPCVGAHRTVIRRMWEMLPAETRVTIVPRGSTPATAAAIEAHGLAR